MAVVCVNYASHDLIERNLRPEELAIAGADVYVVDNLSSSKARREIEQLCAARGWSLLATDENLGFGRGVNMGVAKALADGHNYLVFVNPDAQVRGEVLVGLRRTLAQQPRALVSPRIVRPSGRPWFTGGRLDLLTGDVTGTAGTVSPTSGTWLTAACLATSREMWELLGGFDPDYFLYWEDVDLSRRAVFLGSDLVLRDDLTVVHDPGGTQGSPGPKSEIYIYFNCRNRLVFAAKNLDYLHQFRWILHSPAHAVRVLLRGDRESVRGLLAAAGAASRGTFAGARYLWRSRGRARSQSEAYI